MFEIVLAVFSNVRAVAIPVAIFLTIGLTLTFVAQAWAHDFFNDKDEESLNARMPKIRSKLIAWIIVSAVVTCVPTIDDLWKVRIGLIKYQLASSENVQTGVDTIERIGKKLECKYLGGCDEKKPER
jgi:hypothetical protein